MCVKGYIQIQTFIHWETIYIYKYKYKVSTIIKEELRFQVVPMLRSMAQHRLQLWALFQLPSCNLRQDPKAQGGPPLAPPRPLTCDLHQDL